MCTQDRNHSPSCCADIHGYRTYARQRRRRHDARSTDQDDRCNRCCHASEEDCQVDRPRAGCVAARLYWHSSQSHYTRHDPKVRSWSEGEIFTATLSGHSPAAEKTSTAKSCIPSATSIAMRIKTTRMP